MRQLLLVMLISMPCASWAADEHRLSFLEQEVRNLQRQVQSLSRQLDELRTRPDRPASPVAAPRANAPSSDPARWLDVSRWKQLRPGMSELEVISSLGPPTSMRDEGGARVLLYAMEIGASGFLGGSVTLRDHNVAEVRLPTLQ
jgi:hypothetical protein